MTSFIPANLPSDINTLEKLKVWVDLALANLNPRESLNIRFPDGSVLTESSIAISHFDDNNQRRILSCQSYLVMNPGYDFDRSKKLWQWVEELGTVALPEGFKTP